MAGKRRGFGGWLAGPGKYLIGLVIIAAGGWYWYAQGEAEATKPSYRLARIERGTISNTVTASGTLKALITVDVGTQISGQIRQLFADFNTEVKKGQVIARIDPSAFEAKLREAEADLATAKGNVQLMEARLESLRAETLQARSAQALARLDLERKKELLPSRAIAQSAYDQAVAAAEQADARVQGTLAKEAEQKAQIEVARAQVMQKEATLSQRRIDLENTYIRSPVDGVVIARNVDVGQTVAASLQSPVLFTIAQDLKQMQVEVNVDEADIGRLREGLPATFTVDSFPGRTFPGKVRQVRKAPKEVSSVITYTVVVSTENPDLRLLPGMTANVVFQIQRRADVVMVPNAALRFRPAGAGTDRERSTSGEGRRERGASPGGTTSRGNPRERLERQVESLKRELSLTKAQEDQVRAIYRDLGERMRGLFGGGAPREEIREEIAKLRRASEEKIAAILDPEQRAKYDELRGAASDGSPRRGSVYVLGPDGAPKRVAIVVGITDGANTELLRGDLKAGDQVIVGTAGRGPAAPQPRRGGRRFGL